MAHSGLQHRVSHADDEFVIPQSPAAGLQRPASALRAPRRGGAGAAPCAMHGQAGASRPPLQLCGMSFHAPRRRVLIKVLAVLAALLVALQALSCGIFICVAPVPFGHHARTTSFIDARDIVSDVPITRQDALLTSSSSADDPFAATGSDPWDSLGSSGGGGDRASSTPKLIPRIIHQTQRSRRLPRDAQPLVASWRAINGDGWEVRFYDDSAALSFVRREFPEYLEAYMALPKEVERADFFKYMVVLRVGGAYADVDTECRRPLDPLITPTDTLVVGWDAASPDTTTAARRGAARPRQLVPWFFAAAPGHPALRELCNLVARNALHGSSSSSSSSDDGGLRETQERTGQGLWTDVVLRHAAAGSKGTDSKAANPWRVRILPRIAFGAHPAALDGLDPESRDVVVLHHFRGTWQSKGHSSSAGFFGRWHLWGASKGGRAAAPPHRKAMQTTAGATGASRQRQNLEEEGEAETSGEAPAAAKPLHGAPQAALLPVSAAFDPPFTVLVRGPGAGDAGGGGADVAAELADYGSYQPALLPSRRPSVVDALIGSLGPSQAAAAAAVLPKSPPAASSGTTPAAATAEATGAAAKGKNAGSKAAAGSRGVFVDVGAGEGFFSLAAATRGHRVVSFEASPLSVEALKAGVEYNGFGALMEVVDNVTLGAARGFVCAAAAGGSGAITEDAAEQQQQEEEQDQQQGDERPRHQETRLRERRLRESAARARRGYLAPTPSLSATAASGSESAKASADKRDACAQLGGRLIARKTLSKVLGSRTDVATVRISAHGHEGWIIDGLIPYLTTTHRPAVIYLEFCPAAMRAAGYSDPAAAIRKLRAFGYGDAAHAGRVCDARWSNVTAALRAQGTFSPTAQLALHQPVWCKLRPENDASLIAEADPDLPESLLFVLRSPEDGKTPAAADANRAAAGAPVMAAAAKAKPQAGGSKAAKGSGDAATPKAAASGGGTAADDAAELAG